MTTLRRCGAEIWDGGDGIWARSGPPCAMPDLAWPSGEGEGEGEGKEGGTRQGLGGEWALPSVEPSDVAPGCGVHAFISSSFTAVRVSLVFFLALTVHVCTELDPCLRDSCL